MRRNLLSHAEPVNLLPRRSERLTSFTAAASCGVDRLHCDGYCDSSQYISGGRAATVVLYCEVRTQDHRQYRCSIFDVQTR
eukprot:23088-Eustigmatos_ZCMA.PRE.1